jgi:hypothetical protein
MGGAILDLVRELCSWDVRDVLQHFDKTGLNCPGLFVPSTSAGISRGAARRSDTVSEDQISGGEKEKSVALELVGCKSLEHPFFCNTSQSGVLIMILRTNTSLRSTLRPRRTLGATLPSLLLRERALRHVTRYLRGLQESIKGDLP